MRVVRPPSRPSPIHHVDHSDRDRRFGVAIFWVMCAVSGALIGLAVVSR